MSKGTALRPIRVPEDLYAQILAEIRRTNPNRMDEEFNFSSWMLCAAREKLDLAWRRRTSRNRRKRLKGAKAPADVRDQVEQVTDQVEQVTDQVEQVEQVEQQPKKSKKKNKQTHTVEQLPDVDHVAESLGYQPQGPGWELTERVLTAEELQAEQQREERRD